jgi:hypothetical protein
MLYSGAKGTMTPNNRLQRTALPRRALSTSREIASREPGTLSFEWDLVLLQA